MDTFYQNVYAVVEYLKANGIRKSTIQRHKCCYSLLFTGLSAANATFSRQSVGKWIKEFKKGHSTRYIGAVELYIERLFDVYETGKVREEHSAKPTIRRVPILETFHHILEQYMADCADWFSPKYLPSIKSRCTRFLQFISSYGVQEISGITYEILIEFRKNDTYQKAVATQIYQTVIRDFLVWLAGKGECSYGLSKYLYYAHLGKILFLDEIPGKQKADIETLRPDSMDFPVTELPELFKDFLALLQEHAYSEPVRNVYEDALWQLYLFLDMNHLGYHPDIANTWIEVRRKPFGQHPDKIRRAICLFRQFIEDNNIRPQTVFKKLGTLLEQVPEWCIQSLMGFLEIKEKSGLAPSTITSYRCACARFCIFLGQQKLQKYSEITTGLIKKFNLMDTHQTPGSKNLYNGKIRQFLIYLADNGVLENPDLFLSLSRRSAGYERVVVTLTNDELQNISEYMANTEGASGIRDRAILELGLHMGLRASDIVNLKPENIDWKNACIRFIQKKTSKETVLPMPVSVGNALYLYITEARPKSGCPYIFLKSKAPYTKLAEQACARALNRALPNRDIPGSGFHVTRKTFSRGLLRGGCHPDSIVDLMGHSDRQSLVRYLSLDQDGMRLCPLSLAEAGIAMEGGLFHA